MQEQRRTFLKKAALAGTAVALFPSCLSSSNSQLPVGLQLYTVRDQMTADPKDTLSKVAGVGYKKIETAGYADGKIYGFAPSEFKKIIGDLGLEYASGHVPLTAFQNNFNQVLDSMLEAGQEYAVLPWLDNTQRSSIDLYKGYAALMNTCGEQARAAGVRLAYHNHDFEFMAIDGLMPMDILLNETDPELVDFELDLYWITKAGFDPLQFFKDNPGRVTMWHVKDLANTPERGFEDVGSGVIDFKSIFEAASISGMKHFFVERDVSDDPMVSIANSYKYLTSTIL